MGSSSWLTFGAKRATSPAKPCKRCGWSGTLDATTHQTARQGRCLDRNESAASAPTNGRRSSNGRCGRSLNSTNKSDLSSCTTKPQGSEPKRSMSPSARCPAKLMNLNAPGWRACFPLEKLVEQEHQERPCLKRFARPSEPCTPRCPPCPGEKLRRCGYIRFGRRPDHKSVKHIATSAGLPTVQQRRYQSWHQMTDPAERKLAVIRLHSEGWSVTSIAEYLQTSRPTVYQTLERWHEEGVAGLPEKSNARRRSRKATLAVRNEIRKLQQNPLLGEYRVHTALKRLGIEVSPATCGRIMAAHRKLYGIEKEKASPRPKLEMPFKARRRHEYWRIDLRYIEEHLLPDPKLVYVITVFENFSRMVLSSRICPTQNQWDYLTVRSDALRRYGAPEAIVTDGGGIFVSNQALQLYDLLGIRKERIDPGEPWQNYAETLFSVQRRMADHSFSLARSWPEMQRAHQTWWTNYNVEHHLAHHARQDSRHSPIEVLRGVLGRTYPEEVLSKVLYATQFTRHLDKHGYVRFKNWRFFGEDGLAGQEVCVWTYEGTLKIEYQTTTLSEFAVRFDADRKHSEEVKKPRR